MAEGYARVIIWSQVFTTFFRYSPDSVPWAYVIYTAVVASVFEVLAWRDRRSRADIRRHIQTLRAAIEEEYRITSAERTELRQWLQNLSTTVERHRYGRPHA